MVYIHFIRDKALIKLSEIKGVYIEDEVVNVDTSSDGDWELPKYKYNEVISAIENAHMMPEDVRILEV